MERNGIEYKFIIFVILLFILYFFVRMIYNSYRLRKEYFTTKEQMENFSYDNTMSVNDGKSYNVCKGGEDYYKKAMNPHICSSGEGLDRKYHYYQNCKYVDKDDNCVCCFPAAD